MVYCHPRDDTPIRNTNKAKKYCSQNQIVYDAKVFNFGNKGKRAGPDEKQAFLAHVELPVSFEETQISPEKAQWDLAINEELESIQERDVYELVERPKEEKIIGSTWVFTLKKDEQGLVQRYKARLVAQGFKQKKGIDYTDT